MRLLLCAGNAISLQAFFAAEETDPFNFLF